MGSAYILQLYLYNSGIVLEKQTIVGDSPVHEII